MVLFWSVFYLIILNIETGMTTEKILYQWISLYLYFAGCFNTSNPKKECTCGMYVDMSACVLVHMSVYMDACMWVDLCVCVCVCVMLLNNIYNKMINLLFQRKIQKAEEGEVCIWCNVFLAEDNCSWL